MSSKGASHNVQLRISRSSDGNSSHRPAPDSSYEKCNAATVATYCGQLVKAWMKENGSRQRGMEYTLDKLPQGYQLFERQRSNSLYRDKYMFGHPSGIVFDSVKKFYPHFRFLMQKTTGAVCACDNCRSWRVPIVSISAKITTASVRYRSSGGLREEDNEDNDTNEWSGGESVLTNYDPVHRRKINGDMYAHYLNKLSQVGTIDVQISEKYSMDWRAERSVLARVLKATVEQHAFIPRIGELVLWSRKIEGLPRLEARSNEIRMYDPKIHIYHDQPEWMAGVITEVPEESVKFADLLGESDKHLAINKSGFRVECFPKPGSGDKSLSKQYSYVPMHHIRPIIFWQDILRGISQASWHPSIQHALSAFSTLSVFGRHHITGTWPKVCNVSVSGMFLGTDSLFLGDVVRIKPSVQTDPTTDVVLITKIIVRFTDFRVDDDETIQADSPAALNIFLLGQRYTVDPNQPVLTLHRKIDDTNLPKSMHGYGPWYALNSANRITEISYDRVIGRLYDREAVQKWLGDPKGSGLDFGVLGLHDARVYSAMEDRRILSPNKWYWANDRVDGLDLATVTNIEVGKYAEKPDHESWQKALAIIDAMESRRTVD